MKDIEIKTPVGLIYDSFKNSGKSGFLEWIVENEHFLREFEKQLIVHTVDDARGGDGEVYWGFYSGKDANVFLEKPFFNALKKIDHEKQ
jgi:hypothetical protein